MRTFAERKGTKLGSVAQPLRAALTGRTTSPGIFDVLAVLDAIAHGDVYHAPQCRPLPERHPSVTGAVPLFAALLPSERVDRSSLAQCGVVLRPAGTGGGVALGVPNVS